MPEYIHPFLGRGRGFLAQGGKGLGGVQKMHLLDAESIAATQNGRNIVRIMDIIDY
jgi:hypothetical protein